MLCSLDELLRRLPGVDPSPSLDPLTLGDSPPPDAASVLFPITNELDVLNNPPPPPPLPPLTLLFSPLSPPPPPPPPRCCPPYPSITGLPTPASLLPLLFEVLPGDAVSIPGDPGGRKSHGIFSGGDVERWMAFCKSRFSTAAKAGITSEMGAMVRRSDMPRYRCGTFSQGRLIPSTIR